MDGAVYSGAYGVHILLCVQCGRQLQLFQGLGTLSDISKSSVSRVSIEIAAGTTVFCLLLGYPVAYILSNMRKSIAAFISVLFFVPMWMNFVLRTYDGKPFIGIRHTQYARLDG